MSSIENKVCIKILDRAEVGEKKYGTTMERTDLGFLIYLKLQNVSFIILNSMLTIWKQN